MAEQLTEDETSQFRKDQEPSKIFNVSIRGWISLMIVATLCVAVLTVIFAAVFGGWPYESAIVVFNGQKDLGFLVVGFFFGVAARERFSKNLQPTTKP